VSHTAVDPKPPTDLRQQLCSAFMDEFASLALMSDNHHADRPAHIDERTAELVADAMFALSTPSRVQILGCLLDGPHAVGELVEALGMEQSTVSHQLRVLREYTLVKVDRVGRRRVYALYDEHVTALLDEAVRHVHQRGRLRRASPPGTGTTG
jgi:ArsR family transcriptional regulator, nickel/cobalt-responsive transcriptional repressor